MPRVIPSVARALNVLELFLAEQCPLSVPEIVERLGLPRTTAHELVNTLLHVGYLRRDVKHFNKVFLGPKVLELGNVYAAKMDLISEGRKVAEEIVANCDETVQMAILDGTEAVFVAKVDCSKMVRLISRVGSRLPAHCTAVGKMMLSGLSDQEIDELYHGRVQLERMTENSIVSLAQLKHELTVIRKRGLSYDDCESNTDVRCVSAPIYNQTGKVIAAMSISVPISRITPLKQDELAVIIRKGAKEVSRSMGYGVL
ncbi:MAG: IclR family transcriptional regulator [Desulfarculaceae bacterium]|nr:IclR family transcriptional regulator [Desulfarculaceae bacterium]MCF8048245.1 IclR family transcriptional regulator [Desulfarculaceae bacterium]MCF8064290.1 IclR family transcriptional regulator [Desulfarculaceae bacterium]MCF8096529.1 IclR family transcriptional regulator [Desulfarculaceae bacterium]MCF8121783.1 IclR family transcriptional regulator [Desulfarculaceae bacterium]